VLFFGLFFAVFRSFFRWFPWKRQIVLFSVFLLIFGLFSVAPPPGKFSADALERNCRFLMTVGKKGDKTISTVYFVQ